MKFPNFDFHILEIMKKTLGQNEIPKFESQNMTLANCLRPFSRFENPQIVKTTSRFSVV